MKKATKAVVVEPYQKAKGGCPAVFLVKRGGNVIGLLEKYPDSKYEKHPWKAIRAYTGEFLGAFYPEEGGKAAALAVLM